jgi:SPP1 gp7 family putative phage head morphogenesis protein
MRKLTPSRRRIGVSIPIEATVAAAAQSKGYLRRHGETFAETATELVAQGVAEGRPTDVITNDLRLRLGVVKSRADVIARTESLRAYNNASNQYYAANGIDLVMWYATSDDRTCPICNARAARIYKRAETQAPCHPRCRCYLAPWDPEIASIDDDYASLPRRHREEVSKVTTVGPADLNKASVFEQFAPQPLDLT